MIMPGRVLKVKILNNYRIHCLNAHEVTAQDYPCYFMAKFKEESKFQASLPQQWIHCVYIPGC